MKKKYLTTPEEILDLKDTDTKIYCDKGKGYYQFINGTLVAVYENSFLINPWVCPKDKPYILVEEPVEEITEKDRGKLFKFINKYETRIGILACFTNTKKPVVMGGDVFNKCCRLTPEEVAEITGYKVEE